MLKKLLLTLVVFFSLTAFPFLWTLKNAVTGFEVLTSENSLSRELADIIRAPADQWIKVSGSSFNAFDKADYNEWIRIPVTNESDKAQTRVVEIVSPLLKKVNFHLARRNGIVEKSSFGLDHGRKAIIPQYQARANIELAPLETTDLYINIISKEIIIAPLINLEKNEFEQWFWFYNLTLGIIFGGVLTLIIYNSFIFISTLELNYLYYVGHLSFGVVLQALFISPLYYFLPEFLQDFPTFLKLALFTTIAQIQFIILFLVNFFDFKKTMPRIYQIGMAISVINWVAFVVTIILDSNYASYIIPAIFVLTVYPILVFLKEHKRFLENSFFIVGWAGFFASHTAFNLAVLGILPSNVIAYKFTLFGMLWEGFFLSKALVEKINRYKKEKEDFHAVASGLLPASAINEIFKVGKQSRFKMNSEDATIMFIDIVGYSQIAKTCDSEELFDQLSSFLSKLSAIISKHGGSVDRSLGDGILSSFSKHTAIKNKLNHQTRAFVAATEIQELNQIFSIRTRNLRREILFPTRIGIHTDKVISGNLGDSSRVDYTILGEGVNFASRLEASCNPFRIMVSQKTYKDIETSLQKKYRLERIYLNIKHESKLYEAYECDVFHNRPAIRKRLDELAFTQIGLKQKNPRQSIVETGSLYIESDAGLFEVTDFSIDGMGIIGESFLAKNVCFSGTIRSADGPLESILANKILKTINFEVRWSRSSKNGFKHGLKYDGLHHSQKEFLLETFKTLFKQESA